ncbi:MULTISPECIES: MurR/RpiR family transcriptional regulator [Clostridium]|jgi:DNA-binding MurR/RpiR family transcriptional regulator|uniref:Transcriptional regulator, RpiR family n=1 Tax=Clostridium intestinale DSM 6191 TaxID=1121320 RepID=A0A1M5YYJ6_9CLOT|nr:MULTISPECIES: MurR/RpiR family transcriptional regulator [Clostridium]WRY53338.1 MurR/RpiR family transcriptional regulator [Clostridium intestinale]SHI17099.1 transcriptional regulator, RpiR family [Clostridium intestinale DSM 6191]
MNTSIPVVITKIISKQKNFTFSENEIANFVINNPEVVVNNTITYMANETGTSETSINRFCKKIGFKGFNDFKIALAQDNFYRNMREKDKSKKNDNIIDSISSDYNELILNTASLINEKDLIKAVELIKGARRIYIFGVFSSWLAALELKQKLNMIGISAEAYNDGPNMKLSSINAKENDLFITISRSISVRDIIESLNIIEERNAKLVTITSYDYQKSNAIADVKIVTADRLSIKHSSVISEHIPFLLAIDLIFEMLIESNKNYLKIKQNSDALFESEQVSNSYFYDL